MTTESKKEASGRDSRKPEHALDYLHPDDHAPKTRLPAQTRITANASSTQSVFEVRNLHKRYQHYHLHIDKLDIPHGVVALLGESGAGKTTLLNILALLDVDYEGQVWLDGQILKRGIRETDRLRQSRFCFAFQTSNLLVNLSVAANVELSRRLVGSPLHLQGRRSSLQTLKKFFNDDGEAPPDGGEESKVARLAPRYPSELSVGQRQRVAVGRAMLKAEDGATVMFADEPTANVDRRTADSCFEALKQWQRSSGHDKLLLLATHDLNLAQEADHIILLTTRPDPHDRPDGVLVELDKAGTGPNAKAWPQVEKVLTHRDRRAVALSSNLAGENAPGAPADAPARLGQPADGHIPGATMVTVESQPPADPPKSRLAVARFLLAYCWRDIARRRNAWETAIRLVVVLFLFLVIATATAFIRAAPAVRDAIIESDRLLRLVELESTGGFPVSTDKMKHLASLYRSEEGIQAGALDADQVGGIIAGVSPKRQMPLLFYDAQDQLCKQWVDYVRVVYQGHPGLAKGEQLFAFWEIAPMESDMRVLVSPRLLTRLGFDPEQFKERLASKDPTACLTVNERGWRVRLDVERIEEFPDDEVELLIPAKLARMVEIRDPRITEPRYGAAGFGAYATEQAASTQIPAVQAAVERFKIRQAEEAAFTCSVRHSLETEGEAYVLWVQSDTPQGLGQDQWGLLHSELNQGTGKEHQIEYGGRVLGDAERLDEDVPVSLEAHMATVFVPEITDVPDVVAYLEAHRDTLKVRVMNADKLETVRNVIRTASLGTRVVYIVTIMFLCTCLVAIAYSFVVMLHRKLGEIGILRAYGASRRFVFSRFALEITGVCVFGAALSALLFFGVMLPRLSRMATEMYPDVFTTEVRKLLVFSPMFVWTSLGIVGLVGLVVSLLTWFQVRRSPADLLNNNA